MSAPFPSFAEAARTWMRIGLLSFGGPTGQIAVMHRILVEEKRWIGEARFLHALNYCMLLPGPEAQQLATYIGWLLHGTRGGLVAGTLFVLPGFVAILALSFVYVLWQRQPLVAGALLGLKAAVIAIVLQALLRIARRALTTALARALAVGAFAAIALLHAPFPLVIGAAALAGFVATRRGLVVAAPAAHAPAHGSAAGGAAPPVVDVAALAQAAPTWRRAVKLLALWLPLWAAPVLLAFAAGAQLLTDLGVFFGKMAVVTFGGAYAVLAYVAQQAVERHAWLTPAQMVDGLGLAESTPGPLILVLQFVGFLAAYQAAGSADPLLAGVLGALITVWVTFVPCFLWIFLGAPYVERLREHRALSGALAAITAAVVGVIANLALWFALHVLFADTAQWQAGPVRIELPDPSSLRLVPALLTGLALLLLFALRQGLARCLVASTLLGMLATLI
jgi:chromate transporter